MTQPPTPGGPPFPAAPPPGPPPGYYYPPPPGYGPPPGWGAPPPPPLSPGGLPLADFGSRLAAYLIDVALVSAVFVVVAVPLFFMVVIPRMPTQAEMARTDDASWVFRSFFLPILLFELGIFLLTLVAYYVYTVEYMHRTGQTLGKKILKIRVVPLDPARTLTRGMAAKRYLVQHIAGVFVPFFSYLDGLWQLWDKPYLQTLHDKAAHTVVVKVLP